MHQESLVLSKRRDYTNTPNGSHRCSVPKGQEKERVQWERLAGLEKETNVCSIQLP